MYKILISQQSKAQMRLIRESILSNFDEVFVYCTSSGEETIDIVEKEHPDIVFQSIELDDISGIDVASEIMKISHESHIVFLSCYDYFEFARTAMHMGVEDYLITPITEQDVIDVINKIIRKVDNRRAVKITEEKNLEFIKDSKDLLGYGFVYSVLFNDTLMKNIDEYKRTLGISDKGFWYNFEISKNQYKGKCNKEDIIDLIVTTMKRSIKCVIGPCIGDRLLIYIPVYENDIRFSDDRYILELVRLVKEEIVNKYSIEINVGIGSICDLENIHISYEESAKDLRNKNDIVKYVGSDSNDTYVKAAILEKRLYESIDLDKEDVRKLFILVLQQYENFNIDLRRDRIFELLVVIQHKITFMGKVEINSTNTMSLYEEMSYLTEDNIDVFAMNKFEYWLKIIKRGNVQNMSPMVKEAVHYMHEHFNENISLNEISNMVGVSVQYFSKIFKDEVGANYIDWLNSLRINRAKELMGTSDMSIKEVGFHVGYNDPNYFSRIFKRYEGVAPREFIQRKEVS